MALFSHILLGVDLSSESTQIATKAKELQASCAARLSVMHVIEPLSFAYGGDIPMDFSNVQEEIVQQAERQLQTFLNEHTMQNAEQMIVVGRPETEIHRYAEQENVDLIIVGSHGKHGLALLLGSTANAILHGASCDVLAVRVGK